MEEVELIKQEFSEISQVLDERRIRWWCGSKARSYNRVHGRGGVSMVSRATGVSRSRIYAGIREIEQGTSLSTARNRQAGGGRKKN